MSLDCYFFQRVISALFSFQIIDFLQIYSLTYQRMHRQVLYQALKFANFLPDSNPLLIIQFITSDIFFSISLFFFGYLLILSFPNCILMIIDPSRTPFRRGFSSTLPLVLLLFKECSQPSYFAIQSSAFLNDYQLQLQTSGSFLVTSFLLSTSTLVFTTFYFQGQACLQDCVFYLLLLLFFRIIFTGWLVLIFIISSITPQKSSSLILPYSTSQSSINTFCLGILSQFSKQSQTFLKTIIGPSQQCDLFTTFS